MTYVFTRHCLLGAAALALAACEFGQTSKTVSKSWCVSGGTIHTADDNGLSAQAVAVENGKISYVGSDSGDWCPVGAERIDLAGATLLPGLTDAHGHLLGIGLREMTLNLEGTASVTELQTRVAGAVATTPKGETVFGRGWIETHWPEGRFPSRQDLDAVAPDHPVILTRADGHAVVVNTVALQRANITGQTEAPFGGAINLDAKGEPTGMLIDNAERLVDDLMPELTAARKREAYIKGAALYAARGWTNIHSMSVDPADIALLNELAAAGDIKIRVYNSVDILTAKPLQAEATMLAMREQESPLITTRAIKLYADGALGSRGAALLAPYSDDAKNSGLMLMKKDQAEAVFDAALRNGTQVNTHAIGDRANRQILDWYAQAQARVPKSAWGNPDPRWRIEHSQIIEPSDIPRFKSLGVIPSMQPSHAIGDFHFAIDRLGTDRLEGAYAWRSLIDSGVVIAGGSDAPVEVGDPRIEFYAATQRKDLKGFSTQDWQPEQAITAQEALKMFTAWPAIAAFEEDKTGQIKVGLAADFTAFDRDLLTVSGEDVLAANVVFTMVDGQMAFDGR